MKNNEEKIFKTLFNILSRRYLVFDQAVCSVFLQLESEETEGTPGSKQDIFKFIALLNYVSKKLVPEDISWAQSRAQKAIKRGIVVKKKGIPVVLTFQEISDKWKSNWSSLAVQETCVTFKKRTEESS